jgi:hypothetical protein
VWEPLKFYAAQCTVQVSVAMAHLACARGEVVASLISIVFLQIFGRNAVTPLTNARLGSGWYRTIDSVA